MLRRTRDGIDRVLLLFLSLGADFFLIVTITCPEKSFGNCNLI